MRIIVNYLRLYSYPSNLNVRSSPTICSVMGPALISLAWVLDLDAEPESESPSRRGVLRGGEADPSTNIWGATRNADNPVDVFGRSKSVITSIMLVIQNTKRASAVRRVVQVVRPSLYYNITHRDRDGIQVTIVFPDPSATQVGHPKFKRM